MNLRTTPEVKRRKSLPSMSGPGAGEVWAVASIPKVDAIGAGLDRITRSDLAGYYRHCGFPLQTFNEQP